MVQPAHTYHACRLCRRKRAKCNGQIPCERCQQWGHDCVYDERTKETKDDLRRQRDELQIQNQEADAVLKALQTEGPAGDTFASLRNHTPINRIASSLGQFHPEADDASPSREAVTDGLSTSPAREGFDPADARTELSTSRDPGHQHRVDKAPTSSTQDQPAALPTEEGSGKAAQSGIFTGSANLAYEKGGGLKNVTVKDSEVAHAPWGVFGLDVGQMYELLNGFFDWQYLPLLSVDQESFMQDFSNEEGDNCSPALLRAMLCITCRALSGYDDASSFHVNLAGRLMYECIGILEESKGSKDCLPDAQALGLLAVHQLGSHDNSDALNLIDECVRVLARLRLEEAAADQLPTLSWSSEISKNLQGAILLARIIRLFFECMHSPASLHNDVNYRGWQCNVGRSPDGNVLQVLKLPTVIENTEDSNRIAKPLVTTTSSVYCLLSPSFGPCAEEYPGEYPEELPDVYQACLGQYTELIIALQPLQARESSLILTHLIHHFCLLCLCRPFCHVPARDSQVNFRDVCLGAAQAILSLSTSYRDLFSSYKLPCFVPLFVHAAAIVSMNLAVDIEHLTPPPPLLVHETSTDTEQTDSSREPTDPSPATSLAVSTPTSNATSPAYMKTPGSSSMLPGRRPWGKRKSEKASSSPFPTPPTLATPGIREALGCLVAMSGVFPVARDAKAHIEELLTHADMCGSDPKIGGYPFPTVASSDQSMG